MRRADVIMAVILCTLVAMPVVAQVPAPRTIQPKPAPPPSNEPAAAPPVTEPTDEPTPVFIADGVPVVQRRRGRIDAKQQAASMSNALVGGVWDPSLGPATTGKPEIDKLILEAGQKYGVDPKLIFAVMQQESSFKARAVSPKGASGYMQLMPTTARRFGVTDIFDPKQNIYAGTKYLRFLLDLFDNDVELALAGYNAGEYRVIRSGYRVPSIRETQHYVKVITANYYGRTNRNNAVTFGPRRLRDDEIEQYENEAIATVDDRGNSMLTNVY